MAGFIHSPDPKGRKQQQCKKTKSHLLFLDRLENLDYTTLIAINIYAFKNLTVLSPSHFAHNLIIILITEKEHTEIS